MGDDRYFAVLAKEYLGAHEISNPSQVAHGKLGDKLQDCLRWTMGHLCDQAQLANGISGSGVYVGSAGVALALHRALQSPQAGSLDVAKVDKSLRQLLTNSTSKPPRREISFLEGVPGVLVCDAVISKNPTRVKELLALAKYVLNAPPGECELLYGRAGYVYALLAVAPLVPTPLEAAHREVLVRVVRQIVENGIAVSRQYQQQGKAAPPLMYEWHDKGYWGGAHGVSGICHILLQCPPSVLDEASPEAQGLLRRTVDYLLTLRLPSGNYPSSYGSERDRLVQFCHGATGFALLFVKAFEVYRDDKYLSAASAAGNVVWQRGMLKKGVGLCHGIAGSGLVLLSLFHATGDMVWYQRAVHYGCFCADNARTIYCGADRPLSLFEGLAGLLVFLVALLDPTTPPAFPSYDVGTL